MHLNHAGYVFEILEIDTDKPAEYGKLGRIVITDLYNHAFPIIRYDTGDLGIMFPPNENSNGFPILGSLFGRRFDICYTTSGQPFSPMTIGRILKHFDKIRQWQFVQKGEKEYLIKVIVEDNMDVEQYLSEAIRNFRECLGNDAIIMLERVDGIPVLSSGKRKPVICEYKKV